MPDQLLVGAAEVDITPPVGTALAGGLRPRKSEGIEDPLTIKALVLESGGTTIVYVLLDLIKLYREHGDAAVALASERTGIPAQNIVWAASHTHTGPYLGPMFGVEEGGVDEDWLAALPEKFAEAVERAHDVRRPARISRVRGYCHSVSHNRRLRFKDGREINTWNLGRGEEELQCLGAAGPVDPELGVLCFDGEGGEPIAILWHFTLHTNTNFGRLFSADYPAVVAAELRKRFGGELIPVFVPGACADINVPRGPGDDGPLHREVGKALASVILESLEKRRPRAEPPRLGALKSEVAVSYRDLAADQEQRIRDSQWSAEGQEVFRRELEIMRREGTTEATTLVQAWRIGEVGFASLPGELFVDWGLKIKAESPFPWTFPVELGGDYLGYLVTEQAWEAGGYESLIARSARPSHQAVAEMVAAAQRLLGRLWEM